MLLRLLAIVVLLHLVGADCPLGTTYDSTFQKCYQFVSTPTSYLSAESHCLSLGGHLVTIGSSFENSYVAGLSKGKAERAWIGLNYLLKPEWSWMSGSDSAYRNWASGQPADPSASECASLRSADNGWLKEMCSFGRPFVCDVDPNALPASTQPPMTTSNPADPFLCSTGYTKYTGADGTMRCFKVDVKARTWPDAISFCNLDEGTLPKIPDEATNDFLLALAGKVAHDPYIGLVCPSFKKADCFWMSDGTKVGSYQNWVQGYGPRGLNITYMETRNADTNGMWMSWELRTPNLATFCQKDPIPMSQFIEEARQKAAKKRKLKLRAEQML